MSNFLKQQQKQKNIDLETLVAFQILSILVSIYQHLPKTTTIINIEKLIHQPSTPITHTSHFHKTKNNRNIEYRTLIGMPVP
jgi:hypothetical protein